MPDAAVLPILATAPLLVAVAYFDLRYMRIPNAISLLAVALFAAFSLILPPDDLMQRLAAAAAVLGIGFLAFALRLFGGGDVKILASLVLFVPISGLNDFAMLLAWGLAVGIALVLALRKLPANWREGWVGLADQRGIPMGVSIAMAGLAYPILGSY